MGISIGQLHEWDYPRGLETTSGTPGSFTASTISSEDWIGRRVACFGEGVKILGFVADGGLGEGRKE